MYKILQAGTMSELEDAVQQYLNAGWKLAGGVTFSQGRWLQAVGNYNAFPESLIPVPGI